MRMPKLNMPTTVEEIYNNYCMCRQLTVLLIQSTMQSTTILLIQSTMQSTTILLIQSTMQSTTILFIQSTMQSTTILFIQSTMQSTTILFIQSTMQSTTILLIQSTMQSTTILFIQSTMQSTTILFIQSTMQSTTILFIQSTMQSTTILLIQSTMQSTTILLITFIVLSTGVSELLRFVWETLTKTFLSLQKCVAMTCDCKHRNWICNMIIIYTYTQSHSIKHTESMHLLPSDSQVNLTLWYFHRNSGGCTKPVKPHRSQWLEAASIVLMVCWVPVPKSTPPFMLFGFAHFAQWPNG